MVLSQDFTLEFERERIRRCEKVGLKKGTWTTEEDLKLKAYITRYGSWNWRQLPKFAGMKISQETLSFYLLKKKIKNIAICAAD